MFVIGIQLFAIKLHIQKYFLLRHMYTIHLWKYFCSNDDPKVTELHKQCLFHNRSKTELYQLTTTCRYTWYVFIWCYNVFTQKQLKKKYVLLQIALVTVCRWEIDVCVSLYHQLYKYSIVYIKGYTWSISH